MSKKEDRISVIKFERLLKNDNIVTIPLYNNSEDVIIERQVIIAYIMTMKLSRVY